MTGLVVPATWPWSQSVSVLSAAEVAPGRYAFEMQSGDTIAVVFA